MAAEWRAKLEEVQAAKPRSDEATKGEAETPKNPDVETPK